MLGETTIGTYIAYGGMCFLLLVFIVMFLRLALMLSLLFIVPVAAVLRKIPGLGWLATAAENRIKAREAKTARANGGADPI